MVKRIVSTGNWSDPNIWEDGILPTEEDDVIINPVNGDINMDIAVTCASIDVQNFIGNFIFNNGMPFIVTNRFYLSQCNGFALVNPVGNLYCTNTAISAYFDTDKQVVLYNDGVFDYIISYT